MVQHSPSSVIEVTDLTVAYTDKPVLWDIDLFVPPGVLMAIVGPNGAGKTTLMKAILGMLKPLAGDIRVFGEPLEKNRKRIGYVPQRSSVDWDFPTTVRDVVIMGTYGSLGMFSKPGKNEEMKAMDALEKVGMADFFNRQISELSGGQQQRVFFARALTQQADVYLLDEPLQGVDARSEKVIIGLLQDLKKEKKTAVVIHHNLQTVPEYFDNVALLNVRMIASGKVTEVFTDENIRKTYGGKIAFQ